MHEPDAPMAPTQWQPIPVRARLLMQLGAVAVAALLVPIATILSAISDRMPPWLAGAGALLVALGLGAWRGARAHAATAWRVDTQGLAVRRGTLWRTEARVPATRIQHLDLKRGPLQRRRALATLVVHTAGSRQGTVSVPHLDEAEAEALRDALAQRIHDVED